LLEIDDYVPARRYLAPRTASLWRWDAAAAEAVVWTEGGTIAFRQELLPVLARLAKRGLPPMNALVWLLGACRESWPEAANRLASQAGMLASVDRCDLPDWLPQLMVQLDAVHQMPAELRTLPAAKAELAAMIFESTGYHVGPDDAYRIVRVLAEYHEPGLVASQPGRQNRFSDLLVDLWYLHEGLKRFDWDAFKLRFQTGLEQPVEAADLDLEPAERTRQLIARLQDDEELGGLARIARQLLAAIQLPRAISDREDLPVGGVSDISNRGPLDRLLLGELAHDDLTLAVRVAMNEALYLRRETPPSDPPKHRAVLLDSGVRLWGVPRVFATAVGMALAAGAQRNVRTDLFRAAGDAVERVSLADRAGVVAHLEALEPEAHPGTSLAAFAATAAAEDGLLDALIVTGEDVAADRDFQRSLAALELPAVLLATVSREGRFRLVSHVRRGSKLLREATLDLETLLARPTRPVRRPAPLIDPSVPATLPAILSVRPFPLLLSYQSFDPALAWKAPWGGVLSISKDRCLFHWQQAGRGARLLSDRVPAGALLWSGIAAQGAVSLAVVGRLQQKTLWLLRIDPAADKCESFRLDLQDGRPLAVCGHAGTIFVVYADRVDVFASALSLRVESKPTPEGLSWQRDRFFSQYAQWYALSFDGFKPVFEPLLHTNKWLPAGRRILTFVDVPDVEGPLGIMDDGCLFRAGDAQKTDVRHGLACPVRVAAVSSWGDAVVLSDVGGKNHRGVSLRSGNAWPAHFDLQHYRLPVDALKIVRLVDVRNRFSKIFVTPQGRLALVSRKSESAICLLENGRLVLAGQRPGVPEIADKRFVAAFSPAPAPPGVGYSLQVAKWKDGSRAWLDSRGMLHLKSSDRSLPEVTLVLRDGHLAGWTSQGWTFGMDYFTGAETQPGVEEHVYQNIIENFVALLL
jgi:hypothetical protein